MAKYFTSFTSAVAMLFIIGCGTTIRYDTVGILPVQEDDMRTVAGKNTNSLPVEYVWKGEVQIIGSTIYSDAASECAFLKGRLRAQSFTAFRPSRVVRVEAVDDAHYLLWSATGKLKRDHGTVRRRSRTGTFRVELPAIRNMDHLHIGIVATRNASDMLAGTCLWNNS